MAIYQNTSGSTNVPKTFGLSLERVFRLSARYAGMKRSGGFCAPGPSNSTRTDCTGSVRC